MTEKDTDRRTEKDPALKVLARGGDKWILLPLHDRAKSLGYTPTQSEVNASLVKKLKRRFGSWDEVVKAAGLAEINSPEQHKCRAEKRKKKEEEELNEQRSFRKGRLFRPKKEE